MQVKRREAVIRITIPPLDSTSHDFAGKAFAMRHAEHQPTLVQYALAQHNQATARNAQGRFRWRLDRWLDRDVPLSFYWLAGSITVAAVVLAIIW